LITEAKNLLMAADRSIAKLLTSWALKIRLLFPVVQEKAGMTPNEFRDRFLN